MAGMLILKRFKQRWRATITKRTTGFKIRKNDFLFRIQYFSRLGHKMNAREYYHIRACTFRLSRQTQAVANEISDILDIRLLVIMRQYNRILFLLQFIYF